MERVVRKFTSFEDAERADRAFYRSLTPEQRMDIMLSIIEEANRGLDPRLERVYRIVPLAPD